ncbi:hypothetical protein SADUNF_Sadunf08G0023500 [Salix dunnii]|uniref:Uncharacterized protein n=1 Tax=Salix dunnii TaxID=1413687 RepID=A0A835JXX3_9ROSI|nr:hypothetical protein SADUNF_Sadunf08G0023500 [Salix dunnii]
MGAGQMGMVGSASKISPGLLKPEMKAWVTLEEERVAILERDPEFRDFPSPNPRFRACDDFSPYHLRIIFNDNQCSQVSDALGLEAEALGLPVFVICELDLPASSHLKLYSMPGTVVRNG